MNSSKKNVSDFAFITKADFEKLNDDQKVAYVDEVCAFYNIPDWSYYAGYDPYEDPEVNGESGSVSDEVFCGLVEEYEHGMSIEDFIESTGKKFFL